MLTREVILAKDDLPKKLVTVPEWGGQVYVRTMTGDERDKWEIALARKRKDPDGGVGVRASLVALTVCDESGQRLFSEQDVEALGKKSAAALDRLFDVAFGLNHVTDEAIEGLEKN